MKKVTYSFLIIFCCLWSCKKDSGQLKEIPLNGACKRINIISSHYWRLSEIWRDTTNYGKEHPELIPLPSSFQIYFPLDSCKYYSTSKYSSDGWYYSVNKSGCGGCAGPAPCEFFEKVPWSLSLDGQTFYGPADTYTILTLNDSVFKRYSYSIYNYNKKRVDLLVSKVHVY